MENILSVTPDPFAFRNLLPAAGPGQGLGTRPGAVVHEKLGIGIDLVKRIGRTIDHAVIISALGGEGQSQNLLASGL